MICLGFIFQKISDERSSEPFIARLTLGMLELRDHALRCKYNDSEYEKARLSFDGAYTPILNGMQAIRKATKTIFQLLTEHQQKVISGKIVSFQNKVLILDKSIDSQLNEQVAAFLTNGVIALKGTQKITEMFGINIGCFFAKQSNFEKGISELKQNGENSLAQYLQDVRASWSENFINRRNSLEHDGWSLPSVEYNVKSITNVEIVEPQIDGIGLSKYIQITLNRIILYIENIILYSFKSVLWPQIMIIEISEEKQDSESPVKFQVTLRNPELNEWDLKYYETDSFFKGLSS